MFRNGTFSSFYWSNKTINGGTQTTTTGGEVYDTSGRGGFNRGQGGPGSSYGVGCGTLAPCPICNCYRCCPS